MLWGNLKEISAMLKLYYFIYTFLCTGQVEQVLHKVLNIILWLWMSYVAHFHPQEHILWGNVCMAAHISQTLRTEELMKSEILGFSPTEGIFIFHKLGHWIFASKIFIWINIFIKLLWSITEIALNIKLLLWQHNAIYTEFWWFYICSSHILFFSIVYKYSIKKINSYHLYSNVHTRVILSLGIGGADVDGAVGVMGDSGELLSHTYHAYTIFEKNIFVFFVGISHGNTWSFDYFSLFKWALLSGGGENFQRPHLFQGRNFLRPPLLGSKFSGPPLDQKNKICLKHQYIVYIWI